MDTETLQKVAESSGQMSGSTVLLIVFCVGWLLERMYKIMNNRRAANQAGPAGVPQWKEINTKLDSKVNGRECGEFRTQIGKESTEHRKNITDMGKDISEIKAGVAFLKGQAGGGG